MFTKFILVASLALTSLASLAEVKQARSNDVATNYILENGNFFRTVRGQKCQITNNVQEFKVSQHPGDAAMVYFKREGSLYYLKNAANTSGNCPKSERGVLMANVKKFSVVPRTDSLVVNYALGHSGQLLGWPNSGSPIINASGIREYSHNNCYGVAGKSFSSYAIFALAYNGTVLKIKGRDSRETRADAAFYSSMAQFLGTNKVCQ